MDEDIYERHAANARLDADVDAAKEAFRGLVLDAYRWVEDWGREIGAVLVLLLLGASLAGCAYMDAAHAVKEEGKARLAVLNDHYADDVADLARTVPAGALARMPAGPQKCSLAALAGLQLVECQFVAMPGWRSQ